MNCFVWEKKDQTGYFHNDYMTFKTFKSYEIDNTHEIGTFSVCFVLFCFFFSFELGKQEKLNPVCVNPLLLP